MLVQFSGNACTSADDSYEENDSSATASKIGMGYFANMQCNDDDWYQVLLADGDWLTVSLSFQSAESDLDLELYNPAGTLIDYSESYEDVESVAYKATTPGYYKCRVLDFDGETNSYDMYVSSLRPIPSVAVYRCEDTAYSWRDISTTGSSIEMGDDTYSSVSIGFDFEFAGVDYSTVKISSNGYLCFGFSGDLWWNLPLPCIEEPKNIICPFWDDLTFSRGDSGLYVESEGSVPNRRFIVQWTNTPHWGLFFDIGAVTFQCILYEHSGEGDPWRNNIVFNFNDVVFDSSSYDRGASATIGLEYDEEQRKKESDLDKNSPAHIFGCLYSYNEANVSNGTAIRWIPQERVSPSAVDDCWELYP